MKQKKEIPERVQKSIEEHTIYAAFIKNIENFIKTNKLCSKLFRKHFNF